MLYKKFVRPVLFNFDPESVHNLAIRTSGVGSKIFVREYLKNYYHFESDRLKMEFIGLNFSNPIGLAAGFDKDCQAFPLISGVGFGHIEVGTITSVAQSGNPRPRIFRLLKDEAIINRMGFPSSGVDVAVNNLKNFPVTNCDSILGINIGKAKNVPIDDALNDYLETFGKLKSFGDYLALNVSSPNTPELRKLQEPDRLQALFRGVQELNADNKPLLVKIAPDLSFSELDEILECCMQNGVSGLIATNTTFSREGLKTEVDQQGGLSGKPLRAKSLEIIKYIHQATSGKLPIIGVGGIFTAEDVYETILAGASVTQLYTSLIYHGPLLVKKIKKDLVQILDREGVSSLMDVVGKGNK